MNTWIEFAGQLMLCTGGNRYKITATDDKWVLRMGRATIVCETLTAAKLAAMNHANEWGY